MNQSLLWISFNIFILIMLALDLGVFNRKSTQITVKSALGWTAFWVFLSFLFNVFVYFQLGEQKAFEFFTCYIIEKSLSVDNIFVIILIFSYFKVPVQYQHKVLFWGILGALVMRIIFILAGVELIHNFHFLIYVFGGFLIFTGIRFLVQKDESVNLDTNPFIKLLRMIFPITPDFRGDKFFVRESGRLWVTPLFLVVIVIEGTDLVFAVDSIPAILAISNDSFIVYTSNVFAILGLRSLYFALAGIEKYFTYLKYGLAAILIFVGVKMCIADWYKIPIELSLAFIVLTLSVAVLASMAIQSSKKEL
ncbi:MAG: TerC family protein [Cyclobacteriaceae bacterium]|nr:TerC family protein [Cyclobacteriaceae bacterium]